MAGDATLDLSSLAHADGELGARDGGVAVDVDEKVRRFHFHDDDLALEVAQSGHGFFFVLDLTVVPRVQKVGGEMLGVFVPIGLDD